MAIWTSEIKELEKLYSSIKGQFPALEKELAQLILTNDPNVLMLYSRRCLHKTISNKRLAGVLSGLIAIIAVVFAVLYFSDVVGDTKAGRELEKSIAVLPFKLLSDEPDKQYLADEYNRNWKNIFSVQSEVARTIASDVETKYQAEHERVRKWLEGQGML